MYRAGTCVNSFDEEGYCIVGSLPWSTVTDFANDEEEASEITKEEFLRKTKLSEADIEGDRFFFIMGSVMVSYNDDTDIHTFFVN